MPALAAAEYAAGLTPREDQVLGLIGLGLTNREIGDRLGIAEKTVKNTVTAVLSKLGVQRRGQAIIYVTVRRMTADQQAGRTPVNGRLGTR
jgi:DNA-binding CsgD family transcriptional regulator